MTIPGKRGPSILMKSGGTVVPYSRYAAMQIIDKCKMAMKVVANILKRIFCTFIKISVWLERDMLPYCIREFTELIFKSI